MGVQIAGQLSLPFLRPSHFRGFGLRSRSGVTRFQFGEAHSLGLTRFVLFYTNSRRIQLTTLESMMQMWRSPGLQPAKLMKSPLQRVRTGIPI